MQILNLLAPVFLLIALGAVMQRTGFVSAGFLREANRVTYWVGLPALLFSQLVTSLHAVRGAEDLLAVFFLATGLVTGLAYLAARLLRVPGAAAGTFVQGAFRGNLAFVGLPILYAMPDAPLAGGITLHTAAVLVVAPAMVLYNVVAVVALVVSQHAFGPRMVGPVLRQLALTPPLLATLAGVAFAAAGGTLPAAVAQALGALGEMALPLGLLGVGGSLVTVQLRARWQRPLASALLKGVASPLCGWLVARWFRLGGFETMLILVFMATPTAVISYAMAVELRGDETLASGTIALSVLTSLLSLAAILSLAPV